MYSFQVFADKMLHNEYKCNTCMCMFPLCTLFFFYWLINLLFHIHLCIFFFTYLFVSLFMYLTIHLLICIIYVFIYLPIIIFPSPPPFFFGGGGVWMIITYIYILFIIYCKIYDKYTTIGEKLKWLSYIHQRWTIVKVNIMWIINSL